MASESLTAGRFARFYAPLAATSLLLTATNPLLAAALARTPFPTAALAGYSVAFALSGVLYSPLLVTQQVAATRLLEGRGLAAVRRFALGTGAIFSVLAALVAFTDLGTWVFQDIVGVSGAVYDEALEAMSLLWPVPLVTAVRALHQGRLVAAHRTHPIAVATGVRTGVLAVVAFVLAALAGGAWIGGAAFTLGLMGETVLVVLAPSDQEFRRAPMAGTGAAGGPDDGDPVLWFSTPLMLNVLLWWSTPLLVNGVLARTPEPETALAAFAVVEAVAWFVTAPVGQLQHASIALVEGEETHRKVRRWAAILAAGVFVILAMLALPALRQAVLAWGFGLEPGLLRQAGGALPLAALYPLLYGHRQYYQGLFIRAGRPGVVGWGACLRIGSIVLLALLLTEPLGEHGAALGVGLAVVGMGIEDFFLERLSHSRALPALATAPPVMDEAVST